MMMARDFVLDDIPPLKTSDTGLKAIAWMEEFKVSHLPIINDEDYLGLITEDDVYRNNMPEEALGAHGLSLQKPFVRAEDHFLEVIRCFQEWELTLLPILDEQGKYMGCITLSNLMQGMARLKGVNEPGAVLVLQVLDRDYSLGQMAQLVESNDAKVLSVSVMGVPDSSELEVHLKINRTDLSAIVATFVRFNYNVAGTFQAQRDSNLDDRFGLLMRYLDMD
ncbi:MAG: CBS domain-containing protein [Bacteroidetes bacterium]|jgi:acetoin utilization protein AcuB|nr:CBS domain-containing protein [Bacteroidota bacterium]MDA0929990.1 CBS domain-containing protein [Bacteroidota bacterium]